MSRMLMPQSTGEYFNPGNILIIGVGQPCLPGGIRILSLTGAGSSSYNDNDSVSDIGIYREQSYEVYC